MVVAGGVVSSVLTSRIRLKGERVTAREKKGAGPGASRRDQQAVRG